MRFPAALLCLLILGLPILGGCVSKDGGSEVEASASSERKPAEEGASRPPRQQCENTSIGGTPKSFCY